MQVEETRAVSACPTQELPKFRFWSSCLGDDLNVTRVRCPSSWFMKTLCLESPLHIMLSRPIGLCIRKNRWTAGILSMLQLVRNEQPWLGFGKLRLLTDGQGKLVESDISHRSCHLSIQIFLAWLQTKLSATPASSLAWLFCRHILQRFLRFLVLNSATSNLPVTLSPIATSSCPDLGPLQCHSFRMFQVVQKVKTMPPIAKSASLRSKLDWQNITNCLPIMKCLLFASWKPYTTHPLAGYIHQIIGRPRVFVRAHLDFTSRSSSEQSVIWKCRAATRKLKAASLVLMTHCLDMLGDHWSQRQHHAFCLLHSGILQRWARYLGPCETGLHIFADTSNAES